VAEGTDRRQAERPEWHRVDALFSELLELPEEQRQAQLAERCGDDAALRAAVERLLSAERRSAQAFEVASAALGRLVDDAMQADAPADDAVPEAIRRLGAYRLVRLLGRGGMSSVWLAERDDGQFERTIAIKVLRQWVDGEDAVRRFVAERQILSSLAHPNIVPLLDGGTTADGTPWLATEYVEGEPITAYCESRQLGEEARLDLFLQVADAVHHAHQKLVVHRDLKPSNILVDAQGRVRLLDFGIAKLLDPAAVAGEAPMTRAAYRPMTPEYAAPEQLAGGAITTATDVYQLGVLLYELLTGQRPRQGGELARRPRGDLELIALMALQEDPARRYLSGAALAEDIRNHLKGRAITARPESTLDAARRFFRRRPWAAVALGLAVGLVVTLQVSAVRFSQQRDAAQREAARVTQVKDLLVGLFRQADPLSSEALRGRETTIWESVEAATAKVRSELHDDPPLRAEMLATLAMLHHYAGRKEEGAGLLEEVVALHRLHDGPASAPYALALGELGHQWMRLGRREDAMAAIDEALGISRRLPADSWPTKLAVLIDAADVRRAYGSPQDVEAVLREAQSLVDEGAAADLTTRLAIVNGLAGVLAGLGDDRAAEAKSLDAIAVIERELGPDHARLVGPLATLGASQSSLGRPHDAVATLERGLAILEREYGDRFESTYSMRNNLILALAAAGEHERAAAEMLVLLAQRRDELGDEHLEVGNTLQNLGVMLVLAGRPDEALEVLEQARAVYATALPPDHFRHAFPLLTQAHIRLGRGEAAVAEAHAAEALGVLQGALPATHFAVGIAGCLLGEAELALGRRDEAAARLAAALPIADGGQSNMLPYVPNCRDAYAATLTPAGAPPGRSHSRP
jgi:eukaryotic-like serine/threonine-protein kinase